MQRKGVLRLLNERGAKTSGQEKETFEQLRQAILRKRRARFRYSKNLSNPDGSRHSERTVQESDNFYMESFEPGEEGWLATFRVRRVEDLLQWTLGWGAAVRVLEPESLRERVREEIKKMLEHY
ncbi:WYL domain-containing protein [Paenibacillus koleovorans]|uniref:WYL domain-containing protein n=1 Tax=Paenibacillus koleovorans TaxID=121608 RepID=UPI001FE74FEC|nr:WYL domain-containing protein [Paenibacillus koleovorans]